MIDEKPIELNAGQSQLMVEVLDQSWMVEQFKLEHIDEYLWDAELGGWQDPVGQLIHWLWETIDDALDYVRRALENTLRTARDWIVNQLDSALDSVQSALSSVISGVRGVVNSISGSISSLSSYLEGILSSITTSLTSLGATLASVSGIISDIWDNLSAFATTVATTITTSFETITSFIETSFTGIVSSITAMSTFLSDMWTEISGIFVSFGQSIAALATDLSVWLSTFGESFWQGMLDFWSTLRGYLYTAFKTIAGSLSSLGLTLTTFAQSLWNSLQDLANWIGASLTSFFDTLKNYWVGVQDFFTEAYNRLTAGLRDVGLTLQGFVNPLVSMVTSLGKVWDWLKEIWDSAWEATSGFRAWLGEIWESGWEAVSGFGKWLREIWDNAWKALSGFREIVWNTLTGLWDFLTKIPGILYTSLVNTVDFLKVALSAMKDPAKWLANLVAKIGGTIVDIVSSLAETVWEGLKAALSWLFTSLSGIFKFLTDSLANIARPILTVFSSFAQSVSNVCLDIGSQVSGYFQGIIKPLFDASTGAAKGYFDDLIARIKKGEGKGEFVEFGLMTLGILSAQLPFRMAWVAVHAAGNLADRINIGTRVHLRFASGGTQHDIELHLSPGKMLHHLAAEMKKLPDDLLHSMMYGTSIWLSRPYARLLTSMSRNLLPITLPTLSMVTEITRRTTPLAIGSAFRAELRGTMELFGYKDSIIDWYTKTEEEWAVTVKDRFDKLRKVPVSLFYILPPPADTARMMVKDLFASLKDFSKIMSMQGYNEDMAYMYYLLRYRYPTPDALWKLYSRARANMLWYEPAVKEVPEVAAGLGYAPKSVKSLNMKPEAIKGAIEMYMKWHDYAPFAWMEGFSSDRQIMLDLMADIPTRIDSRWMYKWMVIPDTDLRRVVIARGIHPDWVDRVATAEAINAMTEERSYARTGIINLAERGFSTMDHTSTVLSKLTTVTILKKEVDIKYLPGEVKLLLLRTDYDRAQRVLSAGWGTMTRGYQENIFTEKQVITVLTEISKGLTLDIKLDPDFLKTFLIPYAYRREARSIERIRYLTRILIYRATQLAETGEDVDAYIDTFAAKAHLTDLEKGVVKDLASLFVEVYQKRRGVSIAKNLAKSRLKQGKITMDEALALLVEAGMPKDEAEAFLEVEARVRTVSSDKLVSMMEYIPIDADRLIRKMEMEGVPKDEQALYLPYAVGRVLSSEAGRLVTELGNWYVEGIITEPDFKKELDNIATLWGQAKPQLGVDWVIYSPMERQVLFNMYDLRRVRKLA